MRFHACFAGRWVPLPRSNRKKSGSMRLLGYDLNLIELKLDGGLAAKHGNDHVYRVLIDIDAFDGAGEGAQGAIQDADGITHAVVDDDLLLLHAHCVDLVFGQGSGIIAGRTDEAGDAANIPDNMPGIVAVDHFYQHVTGIDLAVVGLAGTGFGDLGDGFQGDRHGQDHIMQAAGFHSLLDGSLNGVLVTGVGMHYIPLCSFCHCVHLSGRC